MKVENINYSIDKKEILKNVSFTIPKNKISCLIGPNGSGKTTILKILANSIQRYSGNYFLQNEKIENIKNLEKKVTYLSQEIFLDIKVTVYDLVSFGRFPYSKSKLTKEDNKIIDKYIKLLELEQIKDKFIDEISGGQKQRAYIAMILAQETEYIIFDEPSNNLDIYYISKFMKLVKSLVEKYNKTIILTLHEINYVSFYSDYVIAIKDGSIIKEGRTKEVFNKNILKTLFQVDFDILQYLQKPISIHY